VHEGRLSIRTLLATVAVPPFSDNPSINLTLLIFCADRSKSGKIAERSQRREENTAHGAKREEVVPLYPPKLTADQSVFGHFAI
jgi:hypothetical protein